MSLSDAEKERIKYLATLLNTCAAACFTIGVIGPVAASVYGAPPHVRPWLFGLAAIGWLSVAFSLHMAVRYVLGRLP